MSDYKHIKITVNYLVDDLGRHCLLCDKHADPHHSVIEKISEKEAFSYEIAEIDADGDDDEVEYLLCTHEGCGEAIASRDRPKREWSEE